MTSISTWDFSTLYTTIPHAKLKAAINWVIDEVMKLEKFSIMNCNTNRAFLSNEQQRGYVPLDSTKFKKLVSFLIDNIYIQFGNVIMRQCVGIPMGTDCAPLLADLFLHFYEYKFIDKLKKDRGTKYFARIFNHTFRYIDDLLSINNKYFEDYISEIYPPELELKETTESENQASYLDVMLSIKENALFYKLYDKRDDYEFDIINFPFLDSNIPAGPAYGVYISQLIRYSRACLDYEDFKNRHIMLYIKLTSQGYTRKKLQKCFTKFYRNYELLISKYGRSIQCMFGDVVAVDDLYMGYWLVQRF